MTTAESLLNFLALMVLVWGGTAVLGWLWERLHSTESRDFIIDRIWYSRWGRNNRRTGE